MLDEAFNFALEFLLLLRLALLHLGSNHSDVGFVFAGSRRLFNVLITATHHRSGPFGCRFESWVDGLVLFVHKFAEMSSRLRLVEVERFGDSGRFTLLKLLHFGHERLLELFEVGHRTSSGRSETVLDVGADRSLSRVQVLLNTPPFFVLVLLHAGRKFSHLVAFFSVRTNTLLSFVFIFFTHHSKFGNEDPPWHDSCSELIEHIRVNFVIQVDLIPCLLQITLVEREWFLRLLGLRHRSFSDFLPALFIFCQDLLVKWLQGGSRNLVGLKFVRHNFLSLFFFAGCFRLEPLLSNRFGLSWSLHEIERSGHRNIILALTPFQNAILLADKHFFQSHEETHSQTFRLFVFKTLSFGPHSIDFGNSDARELQLFPLSQLAALAKEHNELFPRDARILIEVVFAYAC